MVRLSMREAARLNPKTTEDISRRCPTDRKRYVHKFTSDLKAEGCLKDAEVLLLIDGYVAMREFARTVH